MNNRNRYKNFKKLPKMKGMSPMQILGYVLFMLVLFLCGASFQSCTTAKVSAKKVERLHVDSTGVVYDLNRLRLCDQK